MSSMNFSTSKQYVRPPQRGIFPLDHDAECNPFIEKYMACLNDSNDMHHKCKQLSKDYLQCRMERKLMFKEDLNDVRVCLLFIVSTAVSSFLAVYSPHALNQKFPWFIVFFFSILRVQCSSWVTPKKKTSLELKNTTKRKRKRVLLRGSTSIRNPGGGFKIPRANGLARTTAKTGEARRHDRFINTVL